MFQYFLGGGKNLRKKPPKEIQIYKELRDTNHEKEKTNLPYKLFGKQMLLHWLGVVNYVILQVSNLGYDNDNQQLGFCNKIFTHPTSLYITYRKDIVIVKS